MVDSRIRDIDRSLERGRDLASSKPLPPMPPPMHSNSGLPDSTVFVRNLAYSVSWQTLRDKFSRCGEYSLCLSGCMLNLLHADQRKVCDGAVALAN